MMRAIVGRDLDIYQLYIGRFQGYPQSLAKQPFNPLL